MPPFIALSISIAIILYLFAYDCKLNQHVSKAIWIPTAWIIIAGSRLISQWIHWGGFYSPENLLEGNPIDRFVFLILIFIGVFVLIKRNIKIIDIMKNNLWFSMFFLYCGISIIWSDYPFVSFKRWVKELGNIVMVLVVLTEIDTKQAIQALIRRFAYFAVLLSVVFNKYFPHLAKIYDYWTGAAQWIGVTTSKNMLGNLCLICGLFYIWDLLTLKKNQGFNIKNHQFYINIGFLILIFMLLDQADSATSLLTLIIGTSVIIFTGSNLVKKTISHAGLFPFLFGLMLAVLIFTSNILEYVVMSIGRDMTLTDRTYIWQNLLDFKINPLIGVGYESFWLGERLKILSEMEYMRGLNQAHNGFLETYLNLGILGLLILLIAIISVYNKIIKNISTEFDLTRFRIALYIVVLIYNITEAAFKGVHLVWFSFLLIGIQTKPWKRTQQNSQIN